ncbi:MAG: D-alanine--D-alanine ligase [Candidatus Paceibacterota bacterium]
MQKLRVGVLRGGPSSEYEISLKTGGHVLQNISLEKYDPKDIFISRSGVWHVRGLETTPEKALRNMDAVFNALHGEYGEDGKVQQILEKFGVPYTGSRSLASSLAMNKAKAKDIVSRSGIRVPLHRIITRESEIKTAVMDIFKTFPQPVVVKPLDRGSSKGVTFAGSYQDLLEIITIALEEAPVVLVEEFIKGREVTCGVVDNFRGEEQYTLLPIEIELPKGKVCFDYDAKYNSDGAQRATLRCPGNFSSGEKLQIRDMTRVVHEALGLRHYSRSDFIVTPRGIYFLEVNTLPGLTEESLVPHALREAGCGFPEFVDHLIGLAVNQK